MPGNLPGLVSCAIRGATDCSFGTDAADMPALPAEQERIVATNRIGRTVVPA